MEDQRFDDLARLIAQKTSRRQVLKVLAGAAVGGFFGSRLSPALAAGGNSACAHFCNTTFGADTPAASQCTSDAAHHQGLCYSACGPNGSGGALCGGPSYSSTTCCASGSGTTCVSGTCTAACTTTPTCTGNTCTCPAGTIALTSANNTTTCAKSCTDDTDCAQSCEYNYTLNVQYCTDAGGPGVTCNSDTDCPAGTFCSHFRDQTGLQYVCANATC
jgi:hypothetical protein